MSISSMTGDSIQNTIKPASTVLRPIEKTSERLIDLSIAKRMIASLIESMTNGMSRLLVVAIRSAMPNSAGGSMAV